MFFLFLRLREEAIRKERETGDGGEEEEEEMGRIRVLSFPAVPGCGLNGLETCCVQFCSVSDPSAKCFSVFFCLCMVSHVVTMVI